MSIAIRSRRGPGPDLRVVAIFLNVTAQTMTNDNALAAISGIAPIICPYVSQSTWPTRYITSITDDSSASPRLRIVKNWGTNDSVVQSAAAVPVSAGQGIEVTGGLLCL